MLEKARNLTGRGAKIIFLNGRLSKAICSGLSWQAAKKEPGFDNVYITMPGREMVYIHPQSALYTVEPKPEW
ncbi:Similar to pea: ATP-dependent RNA helicase DHX8 (Drosophila melanogaster), partial [Cotesia congregata]